jgi:PadR family transcriptional regulator AphA
MSPASRDRDEASALSLAEYAVVGVVAEGRQHGFAVARLLGSDGEIGRVYGVGRPAVYRAIERLIEVGVIRPLKVEPGDRGPRRTPLSVTPKGRRWLEDWLGRPVHHIRDLRTEFLVKLTLIDRAGLDPSRLIAAQIDALRPIVTSIEAKHGESAGYDRALSMWRAYSARAALQFLVDLAAERASAAAG